MSFLHHVGICNTHDLGRFVPFKVSGERVGWIKKSFMSQLEPYDTVFRVGPAEIDLQPGLTGYASRTEAVDAVLRDLHRQGVIASWRDEPYRVGTSFHAPALFEMERAAAPRFGIAAHGIHVNGFVRDESGLKLWIGRRGFDRVIAPDKLDNLVAGGQPAGMSLADNLVKECAEEADIPAALALQAKPVGLVSYIMETPEGLKPDFLFCYDMEVPADFRPVNTDGEIVEFQLWPVERVMERVRDTEDFKFNVNLVLIDFFIRHGLIGPEHGDYLELCRGLRR